MKSKLILFLPLFLFFNACSSNDNNPIKPVDLTVNTLNGVWRLTETYISPGGEASWSPVENGIEYTFDFDGTFKLSEGECDSGNYRIENEFIHFDCSTEGAQRSFHIQRLTASTMEINYVGCVEACIYRFQKQ